FDVFAGKKSAQIREILISESAWEEMTCLFAPSFTVAGTAISLLYPILVYRVGGDINAIVCAVSV
ncbi:MAG: hypothetical protein E7F31_03940, partial [Klebsiella pneumoniae]|nr:hypothetical protein [Klebsiella pneumoniae]MDU3471923.1 hypothetical protein [Klebsiella pneumoniae]MDU3529212.1 hypothetical protein [Klebsiella pneumoniae]